jgi:hypothetical protein
MSTRARVYFHRGRAALWIALGAASFPLGWADSVVLVWIASVYANVVSDLGAAEAADDRDLTDRLDRIERHLERPRHRPRARTPIPGRQAARRRLSRP